MVWNLFSFKGDFSFGKSQKSQGNKSGLYGGWVTWVIWCFAKKLCRRRDAWMGVLLWWSCQSPVAHSCGLLIIQIFWSSRIFFLKKNIQAWCKIWCRFIVLFTQSFWMTWPHSNMLTQQHLLPPLLQWSHHCSRMCFPVHSPWLPGYTDVVQTILILLTIAGPFLDRPHVCTHTYTKSSLNYQVYILMVTFFTYILKL